MIVLVWPIAARAGGRLGGTDVRQLTIRANFQFLNSTQLPGNPIELLRVRDGAVYYQQWCYCC